ncbi:MAG TPA: glycoside hydrolase family 3 N-terminal domain-containing protein [Streptosporangiaceae bacterium]
MTALETGIDPALAKLADAIIIPPFPGVEPPRWILEALGRGLAGVTLFSGNVLGDTSALTSSLRSACADMEPVIAIDEEGGDVTRVAYADGSPYPGNAALGAVDDVALTRSVYAAIGRDLALLGINLNLAPCADVLGSGDSPAVGTRSFGASTELVARHTAAAVFGLQGTGVAACAKHFPGHGSTGTDSHHAIATIAGSLDDVRRRDLPPFRAAINAGAAAVMPGHLRVPELTGDRPATLSAAAITGLLRGELGFTGVVISDALEMKATSAVFGIPGAAALAVAAGVDLLCLGRDTDFEVYRAVRAALVSAVTDGTLDPARLEAAAARVTALRTGLLASVRAGRPGPLGVSNGIGLVAARRALRLSGSRAEELSLSAADPLIIEVEPQENIAAGEFAWGLGPWAPVRRVDVDDLDLADILASAAGRTLVVVVRDAIHSKGLLAQLLAARPDTILVEMGVPLWTPPSGTAYLATYGASRASAQAAAEILGLALPAGIST